MRISLYRIFPSMFTKKKYIFMANRPPDPESQFDTVIFDLPHPYTMATNAAGKYMVLDGTGSACKLLAADKEGVKLRILRKDGGAVTIWPLADP